MERGQSTPWDLFVVWGAARSSPSPTTCSGNWAVRTNPAVPPCPGRLLTLLLELLGESGAEGIAITQGDKAVEAFALHRMRVADHSCLCDSLMFHKC